MISLFLAALMATNPSPIARIVTPEQSLPAPAPLEAISGTPLPITVYLRGERDFALSYDLYEVSMASAKADDEVTAALARNQPMTTDSAQDGEMGFAATLDLPKSSATHRYLLRLAVTHADQTTTSNIDLFAYPSDLPDQLREAVRNFQERSGSSLGVFGPGRTVRALLNAWHIPYRDYDPYGTRLSAVIGDFINYPLDADRLPVGSADNVLFLTMTPQAGHTTDLIEILPNHDGKTVYASAQGFNQLAVSPAAQYQFFTLLTRILATPNS